jgi:hypothetical protein
MRKTCLEVKNDIPSKSRSKKVIEVAYEDPTEDVPPELESSEADEPPAPVLPKKKVRKPRKSRKSFQAPTS